MFEPVKNMRVYVDRLVPIWILKTQDCRVHGPPGYMAGPSQVSKNFKPGKMWNILSSFIHVSRQKILIRKREVEERKREVEERKREVKERKTEVEERKREVEPRGKEKWKRGIEK